MSEKINFFIEETETPIAYLGSNFLQSYLGGQGLSRGFAVVSNKRFYAKGECFVSNLDGKWKKAMQEKVVDLKDITGTGYTTTRLFSELLKALIFFGIFAILGIICIFINNSSMKYDDILDFIGVVALISLGIAIINTCLYVFRKRTLFAVEFAGGTGNISFLTHWISKDEIDAFQVKLRQAKELDEKERQKEKQTEQSGVVIGRIKEEKTGNDLLGIADELKKYGELLDKKLITQDEYNDIKKELLSK